MKSKEKKKYLCISSKHLPLFWFSEGKALAWEGRTLENLMVFVHTMQNL